MRSYYGISRVKYKSSYGGKKRRRRSMVLKVLAVILGGAIIVLAGGYLLGFLLSNVSGETQEQPVQTEAVVVETQAPVSRTSDDELIGYWTVKKGDYKGKQIKFTKRFAFLYDDLFEGQRVSAQDVSDENNEKDVEPTTTADQYSYGESYATPNPFDKSLAHKYYYQVYDNGTIEFMLFDESDDPKRTISPDGSDDIYLMKGVYSIDGKRLQLTVAENSLAYKKVVEATPSPEPTYYQNPATYTAAPKTPTPKTVKPKQVSKPKKTAKPTAKPKPTAKSKTTSVPVNEPDDSDNEGSYDPGN